MAYSYVKVTGKEAVVDGLNFPKRQVATWWGKSTWPKPKAADGVLFPDLRYETDTQKVSVYDPENDDWTDQ